MQRRVYVSMCDTHLSPSHDTSNIWNDTSVNHTIFPHVVLVAASSGQFTWEQILAQTYTYVAVA